MTFVNVRDKYYKNIYKNSIPNKKENIVIKPACSTLLKSDSA